MHSGGALRAVCAQVRALFLAEAAARLAVPDRRAVLADGCIAAPDGRSTSYWELAAAGAARP